MDRNEFRLHEIIEHLAHSIHCFLPTALARMSRVLSPVKNSLLNGPPVRRGWQGQLRSLSWKPPGASPRQIPSAHKLRSHPQGDWAMRCKT
eukprot:1526578-Pyramimonas_sp.AAC.1